MNYLIKIVLLFINLKLLQDYISANEITSEVNSKQTESFFVSFASSSSSYTTGDSACQLREQKKRALCEQIFQLPLFRNKGVYFNTVAFFVNKPLCKRNPVKLSLLSLFVDEIIKQEMYPCYGRHDPVGTDYKTDTHYDKFYISTGLYENSVIVYIHKYDIDSDWYNVFSYHENVRFTMLEDSIINVKDVRAELEFNQIIRSTNDRKLLEYTYIRGNDKNNKKDSAVCKLDVSRKATLCEIIFSQNLYKKNFSIELNKAVIFQLKVLNCQKKLVKIVYTEHYQNEIFEQYMYLCPSKNRLTSNSSLKELNMNFYISEGPWENSVFVYYRLETFSKGQFFLIDLLENVCIDCLKPSNITEDYIRKELKDKYLELQKLNFKSQTVYNLMSEKIKIIISLTTRSLAARAKTELSKYFSGLRKKIFYNIQTISMDVQSNILTLIDMEEKYKFLAYRKKYNIRMLTDIDLLTKLSDRFSTEIQYIHEKEKKN